MQGKIVLAGDYDKAEAFKNGVAKVTKRDSTYMINTKGEKVNVPDMCRTFEDVAVGLVFDRTIRAVNEYKVKQVILAGGVSANSYLRAEMKKEMEIIEIYFHYNCYKKSIKNNR